MGNRAVITTEAKEIGVYLHWNGGRDSVEPILAVCKQLGHRSPERDCCGFARLCQVIGNYFGGSLSVGVGPYNKLDTDNGDNGVYVIKNWEIVDRLHCKGAEQTSHKFDDMVADILSRQPAVARGVLFTQTP